MTETRVLVVEDNVKNMKLFRDVLEAAGFRTLAATSAGEAVEVAAEQGPDLVLMDIQLPDFGGVEALGRLRADERTASTPVLALRRDTDPFPQGEFDEQRPAQRRGDLVSGQQGVLAGPAVDRQEQQLLSDQHLPTVPGEARGRRPGRRCRERP